ncbi:hypothetical protein DB30_03019 [Enhygromyxa salina]|uniref:Uncharacterized protein n=1 Tax=Enhygromyxa salina TaxID=215803 RepID=A0A0C2CPJ1_9BACT|nr:hypothetical protein [Enhygromyxa salina]KIG11640.1 hypothetical protein DB30_03019 [Enhygromyxa salina]
MVVVFGAPARGIASCPFGELVEFTDPIITVVDGPGYLDQEQARWSKVGSGFMEGMLELYFDEQVFELERVE